MKYQVFAAALLGVLGIGCGPGASAPEVGAEVPVGGQMLLEEKPLAEMKFQVDGPVTGKITTDKEGKFTKVERKGGSGGLPPGTYQVIPQGGKGVKGPVPQPGTMTVPAGGDQNLTINLFREQKAGRGGNGPGGLPNSASQRP